MKSTEQKIKRSVKFTQMEQAKTETLITPGVHKTINLVGFCCFNILLLLQFCSGSLVLVIHSLALTIIYVLFGQL